MKLTIKWWLLLCWGVFGMHAAHALTQQEALGIAIGESDARVEALSKWTPSRGKWWRCPRTPKM